MSYELETKEWSPVSELNICSFIADLRNSPTIVKSYSNQNWKKRPNYPIDLLTTWEGCIHLLLAAMVLSEFVLPSILCGPRCVISFFAKWFLYSLWDKTPNGIKDMILFLFLFYYYSTNYSIWFYYSKTPESWFILFI